MPKVYNKHMRNAPEDAVYVGRPSMWGNPFEINKDTTREQAVAKFEAFLAEAPQNYIVIKEQLKGKDLVCFCAPLPCHADILLRIANEGD